MYLSAESSRLRSADTTITPTMRSLPVAQARLLLAARSVEHAGGEHEAGRCPRRGFTAVMETRSVQAAPRRCLRGGLGCPAVGDDPSHDRLRVSAFGHDRRPLDDGAAGGMSSRQSGDHRPDRFVVHACHRRPFPAVAQGVGGPDDRDRHDRPALLRRLARRRPTLRGQPAGCARPPCSYAPPLTRTYVRNVRTTMLVPGLFQRSCEATSRRAPPGHTPNGDLHG
jgi:hypothetical protein